MDGGQLCSVSYSTITTTDGSGSGAIRMGNGAQSFAARKVSTQGGDRRFYMTNGAGSAPGFANFNDFAVNNPAVAGMELVTGSQVKIVSAWLSNSGNAGTLTHGIIFGSGFTGQFIMNGGSVQDFSGHGIWIQGGYGFKVNGSIIGGNGTFAANTYDGIHIAAGVSYWSLTSTHFDIDPFLGFRSGTPSRAGVYIESGASANWLIEGNNFASGYATAPVINQATGTGIIANNPGYNPAGPLTAPAVPSTGNALVNPFGVGCSVYVTGSLVTDIQIAGTSTGVATGLVRVPAAQSVTLTYSLAPTSSATRLSRRGPASFTSSNGTLSQATDFPRTGTECIQVTGGTAGCVVASPAVSVSPGTLTLVSAWVRKGSGAATTVTPSIQWLDGSSAQISVTSGAAVTTTSAYAQASASGTAPAGTASAKLQLTSSNSSTGRIDDVSFSTGSAPSWAWFGD